MPTGQAADQAAQTKGDGQGPTDTDKGPGSLAGNVTKDPDLRYTPSGRPVTSIRVAVSERVQEARTGNWVDGPVAYYDVTCWGILAENVAEVIQKGDRVVAEGRWTANRWTDKAGEPQERIVLTAHDLGPSMKFQCARPVRVRRNQGEQA